MMDNIKSSFFLEILFSFFEERQKLTLIKYNKKLQKILNKNIINYKFFTEKYIIYGENRKGKEYLGFNNQLVFDGKYLNGIRNGKGKEYNEKGKLLYKGEYLHGKRNEKGKEYDLIGELLYEGEY